MSIRCARCKHDHASVEELRECQLGSRTSQKLAPVTEITVTCLKNGCEARKTGKPEELALWRCTEHRMQLIQPGEKVKWKNKTFIVLEVIADKLRIKTGGKTGSLVNHKEITKAA